MTPHTHDYEFAPLPPSTIALRVADVAAAKAKLEEAGLEVGEMWDSGACNGAGVSDPPATASSSTTATRRIPTARRRDAGRARRLRLRSSPQDIPRAKRFYSEVLGLEVETEGESDMEFRCRSGDARHLRSVEYRPAVRAESRRAGAPRARRRREARAELEAKGVRVRRRDHRDRASADMACFKDPTATR